MATALSPPFQAPLVDKLGNVTPAWLMWYNELWKRVGGASSKTNTELGNVISQTSDDVASLSSVISELQSVVSDVSDAQQADAASIVLINASIDDINLAVSSLQTSMTSVLANIVAIQMFQSVDPFGTPRPSVDKGALLGQNLSLLGVWN